MFGKTLDKQNASVSCVQQIKVSLQKLTR